MKYIIVLAIIAFTLWRAKPFLIGWLMEYKKKKERKPLVDSDFVYVPVTSSRVFYFAIEIEEIGGGKAKITVIKDKNLTEKIG